MDLAFEEIKLRSLCEENKKAEALFGKKVAAKLRSRLSDLDSAEDLSEIIVGRIREIVLHGHPYLCMDLVDDFKIVFTHNHKQMPVTAEGQLDYSNVTRIKIVKIERL